MRHPHPALWATAVLLFAGAGGVEAQNPVTISGRVVDANLRPVQDAEVFLDDGRAAVLTNPNGRFALRQVRPGRYWVMVRRIGYAPSRRSITVRASGEPTRELGFVLEALPVTLPDVEVRAQGGFSVQRFEEFWARKRSGWGRFLTRDDVDQYATAGLSVMLRFQMPWTPLTRSEVTLSRRGDCPPAISVNGGRPWPDTYVDEFHHSQIEAIEVYRRGRRLPVDFVFDNQASRCGLIVLWLR